MAPPARGGGAWRCSSSLLEIARAFTAFVALAPRGAGCAVPHAPRGARGAAGGGAQLCEREAGCVRACGVRCIAECCREPACMAGEAGASEWEYPLEHGAACFQRCEDACHDEHDAGVPATPAESCMDAGTEACTAECGMPWPEDFYYAEPEPSDEDDAAMLCFHRCFANHLRSQTIVPPEDCTNCELRCSGDCLTTCEEGGASSDEALLDCTDECAQECMETCVDVVHVFVFNVDTGEVEPREVHLSGLLDDSYADDAGAEGLCEDNCQVDCEGPPARAWPASAERQYRLHAC